MFSVPQQAEVREPEGAAREVLNQASPVTPWCVAPSGGLWGNCGGLTFPGACAPGYFLPPACAGSVRKGVVLKRAHTPGSSLLPPRGGSF